MDLPKAGGPYQSRITGIGHPGNRGDEADVIQNHPTVHRGQITTTIVGQQPFALALVQDPVALIAGQAHPKKVADQRSKLESRTKAREVQHCQPSSARNALRIVPVGRRQHEPGPLRPPCKAG